MIEEGRLLCTIEQIAGWESKGRQNTTEVFARSAYRTPPQRGHDRFIVRAKERTAIPRSHSLPLLICHTVQFPCATYTTAPPSSIRDTTRSVPVSRKEPASLDAQVNSCSKKYIDPCTTRWCRPKAFLEIWNVIQ